VNRKRGLLLSMACFAAAHGSCRAAQPAAPGDQPGALRSAPIVFHYDDVQKGSVDSTALQGRPAVIIFITTYDLASQAQARFLTMVERRQGPRIRVAAVVLEPPENRPLVIGFRDALHLDYPVALGDRELVAGRGPFGNVHAVPTTIVLDKNGQIAWRNVGLAKDTEIEAAIGAL
jgi:hypothetical protein